MLNTTLDIEISCLELLKIIYVYDFYFCCYYENFLLDYSLKAILFAARLGNPSTRLFS